MRKGCFGVTFRQVGAVALILTLALTLASCGKKPGSVDPPLGAENEKFPNVYPDPATDPKP